MRLLRPRAGFVQLLVGAAHRGVDVRFLGMVSAVGGGPESVRQQMVLALATEWRKGDEVLRLRQQAFDDTDTPAIFTALGCSIYLE